MIIVIKNAVNILIGCEKPITFSESVAWELDVLRDRKSVV